VLDPRISLAFAIHSNPGAYALLLGSGVSRSAEIPTGWEVVLDLIERVAQLSDADTAGDPVAWFRERYEREPDYSVLLEALAGEPAERQRLLRAYFEPDDDDREQGRKMPTAAHRAIAELVRDGAIRVIVTTNFDRLLERALEDVGIVPTVLATADAVEGAMPLAHTQCTIVKVHGDYLDARIRNTPAELASYDERIDGILDRIFDEYGLIVCGWSGEWDTALRAAIARCPTRRFTTYWAARGALRDQARELVELRRGAVIEIEGADDFFVHLQEKVKSLEEVGGQHPLSAALAKATLKRYLADDRHRIRLHDLFADELTRVESEVTDEAFPPHSPDEVPNPETMRRRLHRYEAICDALMSLNAVAGYWGERQHRAALVKSLERLVTSSQRDQGGYTVWVALRQYPTLLALYAAGLGASIARRLETLAHLFGDVSLREYNERRPLLFIASPNDVVEGRLLQPEGQQQRRTPVNDYLADVLREPLREFAPTEEQWNLEFDRFEYLFNIAFADLRFPDGEIGWAPLGSFLWRRGGPFRDDTMFEDIEAEARAAGEEWPFLRGPLFGGSLDRFLAVKAGVEQFAARRPW
jgi:hypothetical protein